MFNFLFKKLRHNSDAEHPVETEAADTMPTDASTVNTTSVDTAPDKELSAKAIVPVEDISAAPADDLAIIAVISAAVAAASSRDPSSFRVVSFKRANTNFSYRK